MIQLGFKKLSSQSINRLKTLQTNIDSKDNFNEKVSTAKRLWNNKNGSAAGKSAFKEVKKSLKDMFPAPNICQYCENNEAADIEHISPKSYFPKLTFVWENYLLVCKLCNTGFKLDKCFVLDEYGECFDTNRGEEPLHQTVAIINPRKENPLDFLYLNLKTYTYGLRRGLSLRQENKAKKTLEILRLNDRAVLLKAREESANKYYDLLERLSRIVSANSVNEINKLMRPYDKYINFSLPITEIKESIKENYKYGIQTSKNPSVWQEIKRTGSITEDKWIELFNVIPEALNW